MLARNTDRILLLLLAALLIAPCLVAQQDPASRFTPQAGQAPAKSSAEIDIPGSQHWMDSGVEVRAGDSIRITITGNLQYTGSQQNGPEGLPRGFKDLIRQFPVNSAGRGTAIARIGDADSAIPFVVGPSKELRANANGHLFIGINQTGNDSADGSYHATVEIIARSANAPTRQSGSSAAATFGTQSGSAGASGVQSNMQSGGVTSSQTQAQDQPSAPSQNISLPAGTFSKIPRRIADKDGNPGDMLNFLIIGSEDQVKQAFAAADWVIVDRTKTEAVLHGLLSSISKEAYLNMPMSELYLFGRAQDYGFAHAEPISVVATRHHLRIWKAPFEVNGQQLWVGAATHDVGFDRDQRNNGLTHKIDPNIDDERSYVEQTLGGTGLFSATSYVTPPNPLTEAKTATGGSFHSDGRVLVFVCAPAADK
jgi:hypothetical protein